MSKRYERIAVEIIDNPDGDHAWKKAFLIIDNDQLNIECPFMGYSINLKTNVTSAKMSANCKLLLLFFI